MRSTEPGAVVSSVTVLCAAFSFIPSLCQRLA